MQVSGHHGKTLSDAIREGVIENPPLMRWNACQRWRSSVGLRPTTRVDGQGNSTSSAQELQFWKAAMAKLCGAEWPLQLAQGDELEGEEGLQDDDAQEQEHGRHSAAGPLSESPAPGAEEHPRRIWRSTSPQARAPAGAEESLARADDQPPASLQTGPTGADSLREPDRVELSRYDPIREPLESYSHEWVL